ncbi:MAG: hypothetical protein WKF84_28845 [Pyrinomonadaceae bacterium]
MSNEQMLCAEFGGAPLQALPLQGDARTGAFAAPVSDRIYDGEQGGPRKTGLKLNALTRVTATETKNSQASDYELAQKVTEGDMGAFAATLRAP